MFVMHREMLEHIRKKLAEDVREKTSESPSRLLHAFVEKSNEEIQLHAP